MTLKQIDHRLSLYPEYLRYRIEHLEQWPCVAMHRFKTMGMMFNFDKPLMSYNQWLYTTGHEDLVYYGEFIAFNSLMAEMENYQP